VQYVALKLLLRTAEQGGYILVFVVEMVTEIAGKAAGLVRLDFRSCKMDPKVLSPL